VAVGCAEDCLYGVQFCGCRRIMRPTQRSWTRELIRPMRLCTRNIPSKVTSCSAAYRGQLFVCTEWMLCMCLCINRVLSVSVCCQGAVCVCVCLCAVRVLSSLAHWSQIFAETEFLSLLAFPFVKLFQNNQLVCFEIIAAVLSQSSCCFHAHR